MPVGRAVGGSGSDPGTKFLRRGVRAFCNQRADRPLNRHGFSADPIEASLEVKRSCRSGHRRQTGEVALDRAGRDTMSKESADQTKVFARAGAASTEARGGEPAIILQAGEGS